MELSESEATVLRAVALLVRGGTDITASTSKIAETVAKIRGEDEPTPRPSRPWYGYRDMLFGLEDKKLIRIHAAVVPGATREQRVSSLDDYYVSLTDDGVRITGVA